MSDSDQTAAVAFGPDGKPVHDEIVAARRDVGADDSARANRAWWDEQAEDYYAEHGAFLGDAELVWGPEGVRESDLHLLGDVAGADVLEIGAGAAQGGRYVARTGARVVATDLSAGMLRRARAIDGSARVDDADEKGARATLPLVQCDGRALPFADASFDVVFSAHGVLAFVADPHVVLAEVARVLRPGGRAVFSTPHPMRWCFPDDPGPAGLVATMSYWDTTPYVESLAGRPTYAEHHRTLGARLREFVSAGLEVVDLLEPEWPDENTSVWGGWSPTRGAILPGTCIWVARRPG